MLHCPALRCTWHQKWLDLYRFLFWILYGSHSRMCQLMRKSSCLTLGCQQPHRQNPFVVCPANGLVLRGFVYYLLNRHMGYQWYLDKLVTTKATTRQNTCHLKSGECCLRLREPMTFIFGQQPMTQHHPLATNVDAGTS